MTPISTGYVSGISLSPTHDPSQSTFAAELSPRGRPKDKPRAEWLDNTTLRIIAPADIVEILQLNVGPVTIMALSESYPWLWHRKCAQLITPIMTDYLSAIWLSPIHEPSNVRLLVEIRPKGGPNDTPRVEWLDRTTLRVSGPTDVLAISRQDVGPIHVDVVKEPPPSSLP